MASVGRGRVWVGMLVLAGLVAVAAAQDKAGDDKAAAPKREIHILSFESPAVDGIDQLVLKGADATIEHQRWKEIKDPKIRVVGAFPRQAGFRATVRNYKGRAEVSVLIQPTAENDYELRVFIDDSWYDGAAALSFDVYAIPDIKPKHAYNVLIVTIDTLRPDRLGCYGYERPTSPNLDAFAKQCVRFTQAYSTSSFTPPAHASLFTSRYVINHGLLTWNGLPEDQLTLAEVMREHGYRTGASANLHMLTRQNLGQGFTFKKEDTYRDGREVVSDGLQLIREAKREPFFVWLHFYDVHRPYGRVPGWTTMFTGEPRPGIGDEQRHYNLRPRAVRQRGLSPEDLKYIENRYDAGIAYIDAQLAPLLAELATPDRLKDTLIIITSDHGENLLEHEERFFAHDPFLNTVVTGVPLLIRFPEGRGAGQVRDGLVSLIDVAPTVLDTIGLPKPDAFEGESLLPLATNDAWARTELYMECWGVQERKAARTAERLIIHDLKINRTSFYDLAADAGELKPGASAADDADERLHAALIEFMKREGPYPAPPKTDPEVLRELRSLGYAP